MGNEVGVLEPEHEEHGQMSGAGLVEAGKPLPHIWLDMRGGRNALQVLTWCASCACAG
jgi:hypothetical protein